MAILKQGILGPVIGKAGPVVSYIRFGQNIARSVSNNKKNRIATAKRKKQRNKIKVCNEFTKAFKGTRFFDVSFPAYGHTGSGYNRATGAIMNLAVISSPEVAIAYSKVLISKGPIAPIEYASALVNADGNILFTWTDNTGTGSAKETDTAILVAFFPDTKEALYKFSDIRRKKGSAVLEMDSKKGIAETWVGFLSADKKNAANSIYAGVISI